MAKFEIKFLDLTNSKEYVKVKVSLSKDIIELFTCTENSSNLILLDKSTAIKLAKTLRTEINKIEEGGQDG